MLRFMVSGFGVEGYIFFCLSPVLLITSLIMLATLGCLLPSP